MNVNPHLQYLQDPQGSLVLMQQRQLQQQRQHMLQGNQGQGQGQGQGQNQGQSQNSNQNQMGMNFLNQVHNPHNQVHNPHNQSLNQPPHNQGTNALNQGLNQSGALNQNLNTGLNQNSAQGGNSINPLLSVLNGSGNVGGVGGGGGGGGGSSVNFNPNPLLQMQLQQLQQQQQQQQQQQGQGQRPQPQQRFSNPALQQQQGQQPSAQAQAALPLPMHLQVPQQKVPIIKEVWNFNLEYEFNALRNFINDKTANVFISIHQEIPGIVARPVGTFKTSADYHFQTLRSNSDLLNIIQLSLCAVKVLPNNAGSNHTSSTNANNSDGGSGGGNGGDVSNSIIWQFNFLYDVTKEMFNEEHLSMLALTSQINFASHMSQGIPHFAFAELMMDSGLLLDSSINWLSYHSGYDLGFFISLLTNDLLPNDEVDFSWWCDKYFPSFYDLKHIGTQLLSKLGDDSNTAINSANGGNGSNNNNGGSSNSGNNGGNNGNNSNSANNVGGGSGAGAGSGNGAGKGSNKPSVEYLAEELHLLPISPVIRQYFTSALGPFNGQSQPQQMTSTLHAYLLMECFKELLRQTNYDLSVFAKFKGYVWGLGKGATEEKK